MIYRLATGAESDLKRWLGSIGLTLALTIGFPLFAAWLNHDNLTLRPMPVATTAQTGTVLGESTGSNHGSSSSPTPTSSRLVMGAVPATKPLTTKPRATAPVTAATSTVPAPTTQTTSPTPTAPATVSTAPSTSPKGSQGTTLSVDVLDTANATVQVAPDTLGVMIDP